MAESPSEWEPWAMASLRISSSVLNLGELTERLGLKPSKGFEKGTQLSSRNPRSPRRESSMWILESGLPDEAPLEDHLGALQSVIVSRLDELRTLAENSEIDISIGWSPSAGQSSCVLSHEFLNLCALLGAEIWFDTYNFEE